MWLIPQFPPRKLNTQNSYTIRNEKLIETLTFINGVQGKVNDKTFLHLNKVINTQIREILKIDKVMGFCFSENEVIVLTYDVKVTDGNLYDQKYDEEKGEMYIELKEGE